MLAKILSGALIGLEAICIDVEVDIAAKGLPSFTIVGLPDKAVEESRERVRSAIRNSGGEFPARRITVNLAPADIPKVGPAYDLPIALGILIADGQLPHLSEKTLIVGELSLDGSTRHTNGILALTQLAKTKRIPRIFLPQIDANEAALISHVTIYPIESLRSMVAFLTGIKQIEPEKERSLSRELSASAYDFDMSDIQGQEHVKRACEIAAAGGHNVFMSGPPGAGKTLIARTLPSILPILAKEEALEVTNIYSITGNLPPAQSFIQSRPFRSPHHTTSRIGLIGGGRVPKPGEISLAHRGVLFLDEFPEFPRHVLEALRQPLEDGEVSISRAAGSVTYPAKFMLVAASNPCPCGNLGSTRKICTCPPASVERYKKRISGPILDRIDLHVTVPAVEVDKLISDANAPKSESSRKIHTRVQAARDRQVERLMTYKLHANSEMSTKQVKEVCVLQKDAQVFIRQAMERMSLSARSYYRLLKVSRTIADLEKSEVIHTKHIAESLQYRPRSE